MTSRTKRWIWIPLLVGVLAVSALAVQRSVVVRTQWKVLPYQTLQLSDAEHGGGERAFRFPDPTPLDEARGYIEAEHAVRLHVVSNTAWTIQARLASDATPTDSGVLVRRRGSEYVELTHQPRVLAQGDNGVFEISVDYRLLADSEGAFHPEPEISVVFTMMSN